MVGRCRVVALLVVSSVLSIGILGCGGTDGGEDGANNNANGSDLDLEAPQSISASEGDYQDHVMVEWNSVEEAEKYYVYRDGERIAEVEHDDETGRFVFEDIEATPAGEPGAPEQLQAVWNVDIVEVSWEEAEPGNAPTHEYVVVAASGDLVSEESEPAQGHLDGGEIVSYEVEIDGLGYFFDVGNVTSWIDDEASAELLAEDIERPALIAGEIEAEQAVSFKYVDLRADEPTLEVGGTVGYRVRAVDDAGQSGEATDVEEATRRIEEYEIQWQRSLGEDLESGFEPLGVDCENELLCEDPTLMGLGEVRFYRVKWSADEAAGSTYSEPVEVAIDSCDPEGIPFGAGDGSSESPWQICSLEQFAEIAEDGDLLFDTFELRTDLYVDEEAPLFRPIGGASFGSGGGFEGRFSGGGHTIYDIDNLTPKEEEGNQFLGLFNTVEEDGRIEDLNIENAQVEVGTASIALIARRNFGVIENVTVSVMIHPAGNPDAISRHDRYSGAVASNFDLGEIINVHTDVDIMVDEDAMFVTDTNATVRIFAGGVVATNSGLVERSSSSGTIRTTGDTVYMLRVGGLAGTNSGVIRESWTSGTVDGGDSSASLGGKHIGGMVGYNSSGGLISDNYSRTKIEGTSFYYKAGLVGENRGGVENCYATGLIDADGGGVGALIGRSVSHQGHTENSYWDVDTSEYSESDGGEPLSTGEFSEQSNFEGWNFDDIWMMGTDEDGNERPVLQWE